MRSYPRKEVSHGNQVFQGFAEISEQLDKKSVARIRAAIQDLTLTPPKGDIKVMQGYNDDRKRLRVGSWRIIYKYGVDNEIDILFIIDIGNRGDIYK